MGGGIYQWFLKCRWQDVWRSWTQRQTQSSWSLTPSTRSGTRARRARSINAQLGRKFGFDFYMDQNICKHENGDLSVTPTMKLSAIVSADSNVATFTDGSLTGKIKGTTDKFSRPSSHICTVLSSSTNPRRSTATPAVCLLDRHSASVQIRATSFYQRFPRKARSSRSRGILALTS